MAGNAVEKATAGDVAETAVETAAGVGAQNMLMQVFVITVKLISLDQDLCIQGHWHHVDL